MRITKIVSQINNKERASIYLDGKYGFSLLIDQLLSAGLKTGVEIDEKQLMQLKQESSDGKIKMRTLEWLVIRPRSENELRKYLQNKKVLPDSANQMVAYFQERKYQDDVAFTKWWIEQRIAKGRSAKSIRFELYQKGISKDIIEDQILKCDIGDKQVIKALITKKRRQVRYQDDKKLTQYLIRQGFDYSLIKEALAE